MIAPFADSWTFSEGSRLLGGLVIGFGFGWTLERAGLGSARKLMGQFLLTDLTVFKVMFSAIVTAMLGVFWLASLGILDLSALSVPETFLLPQLIGGLVFGVGFATGGLCPGTACVASATGRIDGLLVVAGIFVGVLLTGIGLELVPAFYDGTARGSQTLPQVIGQSYGVIVFLIVGIALAGFLIAERIERRG